jgi:hypothetical protein
MQHGKLLSLAIIGLAAYGCRSENSLAPSSFSPAQDKRALEAAASVSVLARYLSRPDPPGERVERISARDARREYLQSILTGLQTSLGPDAATSDKTVSSSSQQWLGSYDVEAAGEFITGGTFTDLCLSCGNAGGKT